MKPANESRFGRWLAGLVIVASLAVVACGAAATSTPVVVEREVVREVPKEVVVEKEVVREVPKEVVVEREVVREVVATPTPIPAPTAVPAAAVSPGKVLLMFAGWGNERFDYSKGVGGGNVYGRMMGGFLIEGDENGREIPGLATRWDLSEDGLTWTFKIREGGRFHDGQEITAEDVWWTMMHYFGSDASGKAVERGLPSTVKVVGNLVDRIQQTGPNEVAFTTNKIHTTLYLEFSTGTGGWWHTLQKRSILHDDALEAAYDKAPIGAGPLVLTRHVPAERMEFERFADYYYQPANGLPEDRRVNFTSLDLLLVPEEATRVAALRAGEADIAPVSLGAQRQVEAGGGRLLFGREGIFLSIKQYGCGQPQYPCHDKRVRQALAYAIDKEQIRDGLFGAEVFEVRGFMQATPSAVGYNPLLDPFPFDPDKARQLLADAGYPNGQGFGKLVVNTWVSASMPFMPESAQVAASFWRDVLGIDVEVKAGDETALKKAEIDQSLYGQILWRDQETRRHGLSLVYSEYGDPQAPKRLHEDPDLFAMVQDTLALRNPAQQEAAMALVYQRLREEQYQIGLGYVNLPWGVGPKVASWQPFPFAYFPTALHTIALR